MKKNNLKRLTLLAVALIFVLNLFGCATLKKKFVRPPKKGKKTTPILVTQDYKGIYTNEVLYNNHFVYWKGWTDQLTESLLFDLSNKRQIQSANLAIDDIKRMQDLLKSPKKEALSLYIKFYEDILKKLKSGRPNRNEAVRMGNELERQKRNIIRKFETRKVKEFIIKEEEPLKPIATIEQALPK